MPELEWIKLNINLFDNRKVKQIRGMPHGNDIILFWIMLLTIAGRCNSDGLIFVTENIPYTTDSLADDLRMKKRDVERALDVLEQYDMVSKSGDMLCIPGWGEHQNVEGLERVRMLGRERAARYRERQKQKAELLKSNVTVTPHNVTVTPQNKKEESENKKKRKKESTQSILQRLLPEYNISEILGNKISEWITYKTERKEPYKEQGMKSLLLRLESSALQFGEQAVCNLIDECMASNWKGIIFDRLERKTDNRPQYSRKQSKAEELDLFYENIGDWSERE